VTTCTNGNVRQSFRTGSQNAVRRNDDAAK
jgi:hypothetical protein